MKLVIAIVHDEDSSKLMDELLENGFGVTKLATTGGFLKSGNTTLIIGVEKEKLDEVIDIIKAKCKSRTQIATSPAPSSWSIGAYMPYTIEVQVGGATIFVVDVDRFEKF